MKTQSFAKILACLFILFAVRAMATVVTIDSDQTDYTFRGDTTYYVDASVTLYGTTTFENGTVLKYNGSGQINIDPAGTIVCPQAGQPAIFTSMNDNSVGDTITGSTGTPIGSVWGPDYDVNTFLRVTNVTLSNMSFSYSGNTFWDSESYETVALKGCQFFHNGFVSVTTTQVVNNLFVDSYVDWWPCANNNSFMLNNTFASNSAAQVDTMSTGVVVADNLFDTSGIIDFTSDGVTGGDNAFYNGSDYLGPEEAGLPTDITLDSEPDYQNGPLGGYYLSSDSALIDAGDRSASAVGLDSFTTQTSQTPDGGTVDIGYHYPIWQYVVIDSDLNNYTFESGTTYFVDASVTLSGTTTFEGGAVLKYNGSGQINIGTAGTVVCPTGVEPAIFTSYNDNTVGAVIAGSSGVPSGVNWGDTFDVNTFLKSTNATLSNLSFSYANDPLWNPEGSVTTTIAVQNCQFFHNDFVSVSTPQIVNNLFVDSYVDWWPTGTGFGEDDGDDDEDDFDNILVNNTFVNSAVQVDGVATATQPWVSDNLFDLSGAIDFTADGVTGDFNAFYDGSDYLGTNEVGLATDITLASDPDFQTGPLGGYYLPSGSPLIDAGDDPLGDLDDFAFPFTTMTTQTSQTTDSGRVDIGYHYFVAP